MLSAELGQTTTALLKIENISNFVLEFEMVYLVFGMVKLVFGIQYLVFLMVYFVFVIVDLIFEMACFVFWLVYLMMFTFLANYAVATLGLSSM